MGPWLFWSKKKMKKQLGEKEEFSQKIQSRLFL